MFRHLDREGQAIKQKEKRNLQLQNFIKAEFKGKKWNLIPVQYSQCSIFENGKRIQALTINRYNLLQQNGISYCVRFVFKQRKNPPYIIIKLKEQHPKSMNTFVDIEYNLAENAEQSSTIKPTCLKEEMDSNPFIRQKEEKQKAKKGKRHYKNQYNWNDTENRRYINFLIKKGSLLNLSLGEKKKLRVNVMMSKFIQTRNSTQCHTHHQKMMEKFHSIEAIILELSSIFKKPKPITVEEKLKVQDDPCYFISEKNEQLEMVEIEQIIPPCEPSWKDFLFPDVLQYQQQCQNDLFMF